MSREQWARAEAVAHRYRILNNKLAARIPASSLLQSRQERLLNRMEQQLERIIP